MSSIGMYGHPNTVQNRKSNGRTIALCAIWMYTLDDYYCIIRIKGVNSKLFIIINFIVSFYKIIMFWFSDERSRGWLLVDSPKPTLIYTMLYLFIVWVGPKIMKKRKAFKLTWALVPYNLAMACLNAYIAIQVNIISCP